MSKFHINAQGKPGKCTAKPGNCRFGDTETEHYGSKEEAQAAYEKKQKQVPNSIKKEKKLVEKTIFVVKSGDKHGGDLSYRTGSTFEEMKSELSEEFLEGSPEYDAVLKAKNISEVNEIFQGAYLEDSPNLEFSDGNVFLEEQKVSVSDGDKVYALEYEEDTEATLHNLSDLKGLIADEVALSNGPASIEEEEKIRKRIDSLETVEELQKELEGTTWEPRLVEIDLTESA